MSTRSNIGILNKDKSVTYVYCHSDGYPAYNGKMLLEHYNTEEKVRELLSYGDISSVGPTIGVKHNFDACDASMCRFYGRDRGEDGIAPRTKTERKLESFCEQEYLYLWKDGRWYYSDNDGPLVKLTKKACKT